MAPARPVTVTSFPPAGWREKQRAIRPKVGEPGGTADLPWSSLDQARATSVPAMMPWRCHLPPALLPAYVVFSVDLFLALLGSSLENSKFGSDCLGLAPWMSSRIFLTLLSRWFRCRSWRGQSARRFGGRSYLDGCRSSGLLFRWPCDA
ncbi:hypothetical protein BDP55DRAFT_431088 [Colletotrichum godetiae]|uniref:Uncharacterized protein n=1 Tax=Colletotrichum godetiae TaxID=1209918 RepID=A0AAJ0AW21_9PEZI|nr:uncharacterized protein BDP55DRAFT_431088 [Colletotrichum godetiae]KAK1689164.1 hypothetical protein BDP55DRAFT_431088 [Colletotrichum godetiae]